MKIILAINSYKSENEHSTGQKLCVESLRKIKSKFNNVELVNITLQGVNVELEGFTNLHTIKRSAQEIIPEYFNHPGLTELRAQLEPKFKDIKRLISVKDLCDELSKLDCNVFAFFNDDIVVSDRFVKQIMEDPDYDCYPASRIHTFNMTSLSGDFTPESYSVHGFDGIAFKKDFWLKHHNNFPALILGRSYWDNHYYTLCQLFGKTKTLNKLPPVLFHNDHSSTTQSESIERIYNEDIFNRDIVCKQLWFYYVYNVLLKRPTINNIKWYQPFDQEVELEKKLFSGQIDKINSPITIESNIVKIDVQKTYDVILPCAPKDVKKLPFVIESLQEHLVDKNNIIIVTPKAITPVISDSKIQYTTDKEVLNIDPFVFNFRPNWIYQQCIKLFQNITSTDYYLTFDVDGVLNKKMNMFEDGHPIWYYGWRQNNLPYFLFNWYMFNLEKVSNHTFIGDMCFFNKTIIKEFLDNCNLTVDEFIKRSAKIISLPAHLSESELYGSYVSKYHPDLYKFKPLKQFHYGKSLSTNSPDGWDKDEIKNLIGKYKNSDYDIIQMHSWVCATENHWQ
jgi:hypothetical protein